MRHRSIKSRARQLAVGAVLAGALGGVAAEFAHAGMTITLSPQTSTTVGAAGGSIVMDVFATVSGSTAATSQKFGGVFTGFAASASTAVGPLSFTLDPFWTASGTGSPASTNGTAGAVGTTQIVGPAGLDPANPAATSATDTGWAFASYLNPSPLSTIDASFNSGGSAGTNSQTWKLGTLTASNIQNGETISVVPRQAVQPDVIAALYVQDDAVVAGQATAGAPVSITVGTAPIPGDVNGDGFVNQLDLNVVTGNWLAQNATLAQGDANGDGFVNQLDLNVITGNWLAQAHAPIAAPVAVPEPAALGLLALGSLGVLRRRRA